MGDQEQSGRPAPGFFSIFDNVGSDVPTAVREKIRAGASFFIFFVLITKNRRNRITLHSFNACLWIYSKTRFKVTWVNLGINHWWHHS